jgi:uncharacterized protein YqeY
MNIETLRNDMVAALKAGLFRRKAVLSDAIAAIQKAAIDKKQKDSITDSLVDEVLLKEKKTIQEMIDTCPESRQDLKCEYTYRKEILEEYCPKLLDNPDEIRMMIENQLAIVGIKSVKSNKGMIMKTIMPIFKGKADMKIVNQVLTEMLG